ncbi:MAG: Pycsar system effector family protein [Bdellovibrionales bacterium]
MANDSQEQPFPVDKRWEGLVRGAVLASHTTKLYGYITLADQKAMGLIILNSIIIPVAMNQLHEGNFMIASTVAIITGVIGVFMAIWCIFPKRSRAKKPNGTRNHLHFSDIGQMSEDEYLAAFMPIYNDRSLLAQEVVKDYHDVSKRVLIPKFKLLKTAYAVFFLGNLAAVIVFLYQIWG